MSQPLNTMSLPVFTQLADVTFMEALGQLPSKAENSGLFRVDRIADNSGKFRQYEEIDLENYAAEKDEGDQASIARVQQGYTKTVELKRYGLDIRITYEMRHYNKYQDVVRRLTNLASTLEKRKELDLTHRVTFGFATSYTNRDGRSVDISVGDTLALFSTAHTLRGSATTFRNILAGNPQFSKASLESMEVMRVNNMYNQFGEKMEVTDDIVFSTDNPTLCNSIREVLQSTAEVSAPNAGVVNVYKSKYRHVELPLLATTAVGAVDTDKQYYWGLASSKDSSAYFAVNERPHLNAPTMGSNAEDVSTEDWTFTGRTGYGICIVGARWISISKGNGDA